MTPKEFAIYIEGCVENIKEDDKRQWQKFAQLSSVVANSAPNFSKQPRKSYKPKDFMPREPQTVEQMYRTVERLNAFFGGDDLRKGGNS